MIKKADSTCYGCGSPRIMMSSGPSGTRCTNCGMKQHYVAGGYVPMGWDLVPADMTMFENGRKDDEDRADDQGREDITAGGSGRA